MGLTRRALAVSATVILAVLALWAAPAAAQAAATTDAFGRVLAYTPPTATASGSIAIGTRTFTLAPGSATPRSSINPSPQVTVGADVWFFGDRDAAGAFAFFSVRPMTGICGVVTAFTPATGAARGSITVGDTRPVTLPLAAGLTLSQAQVTGHQCFALAVDAQGDAQVVGHTPQQGGVGGGATPTPAPVRQLPSTSTGSDVPAAMLVLGAITVALAQLFRGRKVLR